MAKAVPATVEKTGGLAATMPDFLARSEGDGNLREMKQYVILPRLKVVQALSREPFRPRFNEGDVVATPVMIPVSEGSKPGDVLFHLVPILFYPEWISWNPRNAGLPAIKERSYDPRSQIAIKARNADTRREPIPGRVDGNNQPLMVRHLEHLNFVFDLCSPAEHELAGMPLTMSFASGEHQAGSRFSTLISTRKAKWSFGCVFACKLAQRTNEKGRWMGLDIDNPEPASGISPWVTDNAKFDQYMAAYREYKEVYDDRRLQVNMDDLEDPEVEVTGAAAETKY